MYGAILGDMIGAPYEFDRGNKTKDFALFTGGSNFTDDTVMTIAVAEALLNAESKGEAEVKALIIESMQKWGRKYPNAGYGGRFIGWLWEADPKPYGSYGNGSAMRVAAAGWLYDTIERTREMARLTAEVTHDHPEGIKGAEATASAIFLARTGSGKDAKSRGGPSSGYAAKVRAKVRPNITYNDDEGDSPRTDVEVRAAPDGTITARRVIRSSGNRSWDQAVLRAIDKTDTLPKDIDGSVPSPIVIEFRLR